MEAFDAPAMDAPTILTTDFVDASLAARPTRTAGAQPVAVVLLVEFDVQAGDAP